ncbi:hypothetical protein L1F30_11085 [Simiduia sp. 21SJ11W-1]|uniref:DUF6768 family protein n=1 Tax=Simiduia sp. 21SJ11W-1 TaxID=2909669 RepID=UPI00209DDCF9|nr:DUF6768 family protein [Simiduia sp. 21SJ11W-1]UTA46706.1 hypothetical protein L1F30_11085 [Simiduia sp. 21SJ11W-1]
MSIDDRIKTALESEAAAIKAAVNEREGMFEMAMGAFNAGLGRWVVLLHVITLLVTGVMFWTGYEFFTAINLEGQVFWGVCLLLAAMVQIACKQWVMQEMNRSSLMRELKRIEVAVLQLGAKLEGK